jgi:Pyruvate/2-oxoacid:ferredoxin oxidoreductase delta subunit
MSYREAAFYFYTGTGNSYRVAAWMAGAAQRRDMTISLTPIASAQPAGEIGHGGGALLGLVMPTHGFTTPWAMLRYALGLPRRAGTHAVVVATRAGSRIGSIYTPGFEGTAALLVALVLWLKGYRVRGMAGIDMPSNWLAVHPGLAPDTVAGIVTRARRKVDDFIDSILSGGRRPIGWLVFLLGVLVFPISLAYLLIGRFFLCKLFFASNLCNGCGVCAEHCPNGAIEMQGSGSSRRPYWTFRCESCMRCIAYCPQKAVEVSHLLAVAAYLVAGVIPTLALLTWLGTRSPLMAFLSRTPGWVVRSGNAIVALGLLYPAFSLILRVRWVNWFFTHATLTHYYRRYQEPGTTLKDLR